MEGLTVVNATLDSQPVATSREAWERAFWPVPQREDFAGESAFGLFLSTTPPSPGERRLAWLIVLISAAIFAAAAPFAQVQLERVPAFIPIQQSALVFCDVITAALLLGQFSILRSRALLVLACAYQFSAFIAIIHMFTFPGLFSQSGLLGAGPQTTAWLYIIWHGGFPILVIAYALLKTEKRADSGAERPTSGAALPAMAGTGAVIVAALGFALLATRGHDLLPALVQGQHFSPTADVVVSIVLTLSMLALVALWRRRPRSVLDMWLMVVMCAWLFDIALGALLNAGRWDVGFYTGRLYGLLAATCVLIVLLLENGVLYARLARALDGERAERQRVQEKTDELNELNALLEHRVSGRTAELEALNRNLWQEVTQRAHAEADALEARQKLAGIIDSALDAIIMVDDSLHIALFNAAAEAIFGWTREEALGTPFTDFIPDRFRVMYSAEVKRFGGIRARLRRMGGQRVVTGLRRSGEEFPMDISISPLTVEGRDYYTIILRDVTERVRAEEALRRSKEELHEIATVSATAREQEKNRIARELHDELAQALTAIKMDLDWLKGSPGAGEQAAAKIAAMHELVDGTVAATRRIAADLRPLMLDDLGLVPAAEWLVSSFIRRHGIECELIVDPPDLDLADPQSTAVFRIMQESLTNIARHARASRVEVNLSRTEGQVRLRVRDNGRGFNPASPRKPNSFGLVGLRERAYVVGGQIRIDSVPGEGTTIEVSIPVSVLQVS